MMISDCSKPVYIWPQSTQLAAVVMLCVVLVKSVWAVERLWVARTTDTMKYQVHIFARVKYEMTFARRKVESIS